METLENRLDEVTSELELAGDWNDRYRLLVEWGDEAEPLAAGDCGAEWAVAGCSSPLWLRVRLADGRLEVRGASPGLLPRALAALVGRLFDGLEPQVPPSFSVLDRLELRRHISPTRYLVLERMVDRALGVLVGRP